MDAALASQALLFPGTRRQRARVRWPARASASTAATWSSRARSRTSGWRRCRWRSGRPRRSGGAGSGCGPARQNASRPGTRSPRRSAWISPRSGSSPRTSAAASAPSRHGPGHHGGGLGGPADGRPVRWVETRTRTWSAWCTAGPSSTRSGSAATRDGRILAYHLDIVQDAGAYPRLSGSCRPHPADGGGPVRADLRAAPVPGGGDQHHADLGLPGAPAGLRPRPLIERAMDLFAAEIGMDPAEVRRRNLIPPDTFPTRPRPGRSYDTGDYDRGTGQGAGRGRLRRAAGRAGPPPGARRRAPAGHRAGQLRGDHGGGLRRRGDRPADGGRHGGGHRVHRQFRARPGAPHRVGHAGRGRAGIPMARVTVVHGDTDADPRGRRHLRVPVAAARRGRGAQGRAST